MAERPTVLFTAFRASDDSLRRSWTMFLAQLKRVPPPSLAVGEPRGVWRLLASNNREIGRSARAYGSFAEAREHMLSLRGPGTVSNVVIVIDEQHGFAWWVDIGGEIVMTAVRWYTTATLARASARAAEAALVIAEVAELPLRMTNSGRRTTRTAARHPERSVW